MKKGKISLLILLVMTAVAVVLLGVFHGKQQAESTLEQESGPIPYMSTFQACADELGWDWETLAAVAWHESHFNPLARSHAGAAGVMQLMPKTAQRFGLNDSTKWVAEDNLRAGTEYIKYLQHQWAFISNPQEQTKFVLASYNAGAGNIFSARRVAREEGVNSYVWACVEPYVQQHQACTYVHQVLHTAQKYRKLYGEK